MRVEGLSPCAHTLGALTIRIGSWGLFSSILLVIILPPYIMSKPYMGVYDNGGYLNGVLFTRGSDYLEGLYLGSRVFVNPRP